MFEEGGAGSLVLGATSGERPRPGFSRARAATTAGIGDRGRAVAGGGPGIGGRSSVGLFLFFSAWMKRDILVICGSGLWPAATT